MSTNILRSAVAVMMIGTAATGAAAQETLRIGTDQPGDHPFNLGVEKFGELLSEKTDGELTINLYPAAQLGDTAEQIEGLQLGTLDMSLAAFSHASQFCPELNLFGAPFLFEDEAHFAAVFDGEIGDELEETCVDRYGVRLLNTFSSGYRVLFNGEHPVESLEDLSGLKIRVMGGRADAMTWELFGSLPSPMPYSEVYSALQAGVIDGAENDPSGALANRFYEAAPYFTNTRHLVLPMGLFISDRVFQNLSDEEKTAMREAADEAAAWQRELMVERNASALETMETEYGATVSEIDTDAMRAQGAELQDEVAAELGQEEMLADIRAAAE